METYCFMSVLFFFAQWRASMNLFIFKTFVKPVLQSREERENEEGYLMRTLSMRVHDMLRKTQSEVHYQVQSLLEVDRLTEEVNEGIRKSKDGDYSHVYTTVYGSLVSRIDDLKFFGSLYMVNFTKKTIRESLRIDFLIRTIVIAAFALEVGLTALDLIITDSSTSSQSL
jgi:hypothetical protein